MTTDDRHDDHHDDHHVDHDDHDHDHDHHHHGHEGHGHGHENDQGLKGALRYLRHAPEMWRSSMNTEVIELVGPTTGERVLDIGAGMGAGLGPGTKDGATVVAVEPTPFMRRVLKLRRLARRDRRRIEVLDGTAEDLPVGDGSIDAVWAVNTMHHWSDHEQAGRELLRVLRTGGRIVLVDELFNDPTHPDHDRFGGGDDGHEHHGFTMVDAEQMESTLRTAGFDEVDAERRVLDGCPAVVVTARR